MNRFDIHILGCGSALPTSQHHPSCQVVNVSEKYFMIDCGEGSQLQYRKSKLGFGKLNQILVTHAHGDHCLGLIGLISTLGLLGRTGDLIIHCVPGLKPILENQIGFFCKGISYKVIINTFDPDRSENLFENKSLKISTIPLDHRVPCAGFLIQEKQGLPHLIKDMLEFYQVPISKRQEIVQGADFVTKDGVIVPNKKLTRPANPTRSYAYCADTAYSEKIIPIIEGVDLLYHEATFLDEDAGRAKMTGHSTARQAAQIAKKANVKKLILGHFSSRYSNPQLLLDEARKIFDNTILANEGLCESVTY